MGSDGMAAHLFEIHNGGSTWASRMARIPQHGRNMFDSVVSPVRIAIRAVCIY